MNEVLLAAGLGATVGALFTGFGLPIPAPPTLAAVMGVVGVFVGHIIVKTMVG